MTDQKPRPEPTEEDLKTAHQVMYPGNPNPPVWPGFSPETCERIRRVALALAHEREKAAKVLMDVRSALVLASVQADEAGNSALRDLLVSLLEIAQGRASR